MRAVIIGVIVGLVLMVTSYGQTPTRADLLKTVQHIQALAKEQQKALDEEKAQHNIVTNALASAVTSIARLQEEVQAQTDKLNSTQDKLDKTAKTLWWYRLHFFLGWIILATGILACLVVAFLKFTGRLAIAAAPVVAKVP
jgi:hypothetical protein